MIYKTSLDRVSRIITILMTVFLVSLCVQQLYTLTLNPVDADELKGLAFAGFLLLLPYLLCCLLRPTNYVIESDRITIRRPLKNVSYLATDLKDVFSVTTETMQDTIRTMGVGGLFGYFGKFRNSTFGKMTWYATRRSNYTVVQTTDHKTIVLTPDDVNMVASIRNLIASQQR